MPKFVGGPHDGAVDPRLLCSAFLFQNLSLKQLGELKVHRARGAAGYQSHRKFRSKIPKLTVARLACMAQQGRALGQLEVWEHASKARFVRVFDVPLILVSVRNSA